MINIGICPRCRLSFLRPGAKGNKPHCNCTKKEIEETDPGVLVTKPKDE